MLIPVIRINIPLLQIVTDTTATISLFKHHLLQPRHSQPVLHNTNYDYIVSGMLLFSYSMFVWLYVSNRKRLNQVVKGLFMGRYANQLAREEVSMGNRVVIFLSAMFVFTVTIFLNQTATYYEVLPDFGILGTFFLTAFIIFLMYAIKLVLMQVMGFIFETQKEIKEYTVSVLLFCNSVGLFLLPVVICQTFLKQVNPSIFIYTGALIVAIFFLTRIMRGLIIGLNSIRVSKFYLFLYLCTLEVVPLAIMVKLLLKTN